ncbi:unnamed protein product, partial [Symbiodinium sp. KB8]
AVQNFFPSCGRGWKLWIVDVFLVVGITPSASPPLKNGGEDYAQILPGRLFLSGGRHHGGSAVEVRVWELEQAIRVVLPRLWYSVAGQWWLIAEETISAGGWGAQQPKGKPKGGGSGGKGAGKGKGDGSDTSPTAPQVEALPAPPSTAAPQFPKKPSEASSSNASPEKAQLDALVAMLAASGTAMPESIRSMVAEHQKATTQNLARSLHRAVADQSKARAELQKIRTSRSSYLAAWKQYIDQLSTLLEAQLTDQGTALEAFNAAEIEWIGAEREATVAISRMANKDQVQTEADQDMEDSESKIMEAVEEESRLRQEKEEQQKAGLQLQAALRVARQQAAEHLTQHQRDGSRTPRRKAESETEAPAGREGESVDLTKDGGGSCVAAAYEPPHSILQEADFVGAFSGALLGLNLQLEAQVQWCLTDEILTAQTFWQDPRIRPEACVQALELDRLKVPEAHAPAAVKEYACTPSDVAGRDDGAPASTFRAAARLMVHTTAPDEVGAVPAFAAQRRADCSHADDDVNRSVQFRQGSSCTASRKVSFSSEPSVCMFSARDRLIPRQHGRHRYQVEPPKGILKPKTSADSLGSAPSQSQQWRPVGCTALVPYTCPVQTPAGPAGKAHSRPVSLVNDLQAMIASHVPLSPVWIQGPLLHMSPFDSRLLTGLFPDSADRDRFTVCECRLDHLIRGARPEWSLLDFIAAALRTVTYRVRLVWYVVHPLEDLPVPQLVLTAAQAPANSRAVPVDLRPLDGLLHTVELAFPIAADAIWPLLHDKGVDPGGRIEQAWHAGLCRFVDEQGRVVDQLEANNEVEWIALRSADPANPLRLAVDYLGGPGAILRVPRPAARPCGSGHTTCTTTAVQPLAFHHQALAVADVAILPEDLISHADRAVSLHRASGLRVLFQTNTAPQRRYVLFERVGHMHVRRLGVTWTLHDVVQDVMSIVPMLRCIQILHSPLAGLPILQVVATELGWPTGSLAVPFDLRGAGLSVCTLVIGAGLSQRTLHDAVWTECTAGRNGIPDTVPFVDVLGHSGDTRHPISEAQFFTPAFPAVWARDPAVTQAVSDDADSPHSLSDAAPSLLEVGSTTTTTGAMQWAGLRVTRMGVNRTEEHRLAAHVQLVVFTAHSVEHGPHCIAGTTLAEALAPLLAQILERGHGPRMGYLQATRVLPMLEDRVWMVPIIWAERTGTHVQVILDTRWGEGDIRMLTLPRGTTADQVLPFAFQGQGWTLSVNGVGASSLRRALESGDILFLSRPGKPVPGFHFGHAVSLLPHLRVLALPISLVDARSIPQQLTQAQTRDNEAIMYHELVRHVTARIHLMGSVGPGLFPVTIMGLHHGPILLYLPGPSPSVEHAQIVLNSIPEVPPGLQVFESGAFLGDVAVFVTADPEASTITALVASTIGQGLDNLIVVALAPSQRQLGNAVYMDPFFTTDEFSNPVNGHYIRRTRISLPGDGVALACIPGTPVPNAISRRAQTCNKARQLGITHTACGPSSIATPLGRRHLPRPAPPAHEPPMPKVIELNPVLPAPQTPPLTAFRQCLHLLKLPWHEFWRSAWDGVKPVKGLPLPPIARFDGPCASRRIHIFTDGSKLGTGVKVQCGWGLVICSEDTASNTFHCGGFAGGPLEPFLRRPLGAGPSSFDAEVIACIVATCWAASLPEGSEVVLWHDCQGAGSLLAGDCSSHAQGSIASLLRPLALWCQHSGINLQVHWVPSHSGHFFNELVDSVAKAGARSCFPAPAFPNAFWQLLASPFLPWAWLGAHVPADSRPGMPSLDVLAEGCYEPRDPIPLECIPVPSAPLTEVVTATLSLRLLTCNVQTMKDKRPLVMQQLKDRRVHIAGLQETRDSLSSQCVGSCFIEFAAAAEKGEGGVTLLFNRSHPYGRAKGQSLFFDKSHFTCVHADSRCIAVQVRAPHLQVLCVCAHAPHSGQSLATISDWWRHFEQAPWLAKHKGRVVLLIDSNAQLGSIVGDAVQGHAADAENTSGTFLRSWVEATDSFLPSTVCASDGQCIPNAREPTWFSPSGHGYRIDFVGLPSAWSRCAFKPCTWPDFELLNKDHIPATTDVSLQIQARPHRAQGPQTFPRDPAQWPTPAIEQLKKCIQSIPSPPWELNVHAHVQALQQAIHHAGRQCKPPPQRRCRAFISEPTRGLLEGTKKCKKCIATLQGLARKLDSYRSQGRIGLSSEGWTLSDVQGMIAELCHELRGWRRSLREAVAWDKSWFVRSAHQRLLDNSDPFDARQFFDALRALRPPNKRVLKPFSKLVIDEKHQASHQDRLDMQQDHFASLEAGRPCTASEYLASFPEGTVAPSDRFQLHELPTWPKVEEAFRACKARKTPGADQIPDWVWRIGPQEATRLWLPVFAKAHVRLSEPVQFKHTLLFALFKGKGSPAVVSNYRAIALLSGPGKILRKQMRGALLQQLPDNPLQQGGVPQSLLQGVHQVVKMQADIAAAVGASNSALFLDVSSAYYRVLRQAFQGPVEDDRQICHILNQLGVSPESLHCVCEWLASTNLVEGASAHQQRLLQEYLSGTFFTLRGGNSLVHTQAGTRPGDAIADTLFALVQADFLAGVRERMGDAGLLDDPVVSRVQGGAQLLAPVWADDSVVLLAAASADSLLTKTQQVAGIVHSEFTRRGMAPNYTRGKSEVLFSFRGKGAPALRQRLYIRQGGLVSFDAAEGPHHIFCTRRYVHLGGVVCDRRTEAGDICQHLAHARRQIKPMRRQVLRDPDLPLSTRRMCLSSLALSCVTTTAPTWGHLNKAESAAWRRGFVSLLRSLHRDDRWTGNPSLPGEKDVCLAARMPSPSAFLKGQRLAHFRRVCLTQPVLADLLIAEYHASHSSWLSLLQLDVQWLSQMIKIPETALSDFPHGLADWCVHNEAPFKAAIRKALHNFQAVGYEPDWEASRGPCKEPSVGQYGCTQCAASFATKHALAAHRFAKHGQACVARSYLHGTTCPACLMQFWTTTRVTRHLMHDSPHCLRTLQDHAFEGDAGSRPICTDTADMPATRLYGPLRPFHVQMPEFASRAAEGDLSLLPWLNSYRSPAMQAWLDALTESCSA